MSTINRSVVLFVLAVVLCLSTRTTSSDTAVNVRVRNALPSKSVDMEMQCKSSAGEYMGQRVVGVGADYRFVALSPKRYTYYCVAYWGNKFASFEPIEPSSAVVGDVFWAARSDGFYVKSGHGDKWARKAVWETE